MLLRGQDDACLCVTADKAYFDQFVHVNCLLFYKIMSKAWQLCNSVRCLVGSADS